MATAQAEPKVNPPHAKFQALLTPESVRRDRIDAD
jgi:hypothetical protein